MAEQLSRRAMREAERAGLARAEATGESTNVTVSQVSILPQNTDNAAPASGVGMTRRQLRELGLTAAPTVEAAKPASTGAENAATPGTRRALRNSGPVPVAIPEIEMPEPDFNGQNLLAEPSTAAIVLERAPEAIELPIETGEITVTGSIQVITGPMSSPATSTVDSTVLDEELDQDAVTGVLSTVEPVSALELIGERSGTGVVPSKVLRKGWWKPLALALFALALALASIWATLTILGAGGN